MVRYEGDGNDLDPESADEILAGGIISDSELSIEDFEELRSQIPRIKSRLLNFGVEGMKCVDDEALFELFNKVDIEPTLLDDLIFQTLLLKREAFGNLAVTAKFCDLSDVADAYAINPYAIRTEHVEQVVPNLERIHIPRLKAYKLAQTTTNPVLSQAIRRLGWLAGEPFMDELPVQIELERTELGRELKISEILVLAHKEVKRQIGLHDRNVSPVKYDSEIRFMKDAYELRKKMLATANNVCAGSFYVNKK